jgi:hypothetical protein
VTTNIDERRQAPARRIPNAGGVIISLAGLALLSACASSGGRVAAGYDTDYYVAHAEGNYQPPGPPSDPWGPYIRIASRRFDVPETWIREVMRVESGGHEYLGGQLTVSSAGAMGLMQVEPETYQEMAARYGLGDDPFNPYNNIMAGTAYIHEMYVVYGSPGFLAAYNAGPGRLDHFLNDGEPLPDATQNYIAMIAPNIEGDYPTQRSEADQLALNTEPMGVSTGILPPGYSPEPVPGSPAPGGPAPDSPAAPVELAAVEPAPPQESTIYTPPQSGLVTEPAAPPQPASQSGADSLLADNSPIQQAAYIPTQPAPTTYQPPAPAPAAAPPRHFALIAPAMADTPAPRYLNDTGAGWAIQVGAYATKDGAKAALGIAELSAVANLMHGEPMIQRIHTGYTIRYRARFVNLPHSDAIQACHHLSHGPTGCTILSPDGQF